MKTYFSPWPDTRDVGAAFFYKSANSSDIEQWLGPNTHCVSLKQIHSNKVFTIEIPVTEVLQGDALVAKNSSLALKIFSADCLPLLAFNGSVIGACHAGWRGLSAGIIENWIGALGAAGAEKELLRVAIGPSIGKCHFEVGKDVSYQILKGLPVKFLEVFKSSHANPEKEFIDLKEVARFKLSALGIRPEHISVSPECTYCEANYLPSYRREGKGAGRIQAVIKLNNPL